MKILTLAVAAALICASTASADESESRANLTGVTQGHTYFNRPGATVEQHNTALGECLEVASETLSANESVGGIGGGILPALIVGYETSRAATVNLENCMVVRGWRVVVVPDSEGRTLSGGDVNAARETLAGWIGQETPHGTIARVFNNDAARASTRRVADHPGFSGIRSLSFLLMPPRDRNAPALRPSAYARANASMGGSWALARGTRLNRLDEVPSGSTVVIVGFDGQGFYTNGVMLERVGAVNENGSSADGQPNRMLLFVSAFASRSRVTYGAFVVPPGRWRVASLGLTVTLNFCLGSPAFDVGAGDVVYAGTLHLGTESLGPDLALEGVTQALADAPQTAARLRPAAYVNGVTAPCSGNFIYALEAPGAPPARPPEAATAATAPESAQPSSAAPQPANEPSGRHEAPSPS